MTDNIQFYWSNGDQSKTVHLNDFLAALNKWIGDYEEKTFPNLALAGGRTQIIAEPGRKYIKLVSTGRCGDSVYCFLDRSGNIYKSASWRTPAKHIRGSVFDANYSLGKALGPYGAAYLR